MKNIYSCKLNKVTKSVVSNHKMSHKNTYNFGTYLWFFCNTNFVAKKIARYIYTYKNLGLYSWSTWSISFLKSNVYFGLDLLTNVIFYTNYALSINIEILEYNFNTKNNN